MNHRIESIYFQEEAIEKLNLFIKTSCLSKIIFITDENTYLYCYNKIITKLHANNTDIKNIIIKPGEKYKNLTTCKKIWIQLTKMKADRNSLIINLGGGVITDMGGFIASTYMRGIKFINIPTTLLSIIDASVGGKTGINFMFIKNLIGIFNMPNIVVIYNHFLDTLSNIELKSGFAEMLKHSLISSKNHWNDIKNIKYNDINSIKKFLSKNINIKYQIIKTDFKENNIRKVLNFGHTIGHALESLFLYKKTPISHGESIAIGMILEAFISYKMNILSYIDFLEIEKKLLNIYKIYPIEKSDFEFLIQVIKQDKKNNSSKILFSLINKIGSVKINQEVPENLIINSFNYLLNK